MLTTPLHIHHEAIGSSQDLLHVLLSATEESISICLLVIVMMTLIEIFNVVSHGHALKGLAQHRFGQIAISSLLGLLPGCLGGFAGVSLYSHRMIGFGALIAMLIATTGDESFLMLALFPKKAMLMMAGLFILALIVGTATDVIIRLMQKRGHWTSLGADRITNDNYEIHPCDCEHENHHRHHHGENWKHKIMHFLSDHVWHHVIKRHLPTIFAWTFGVLVIFGILSMYIDLESWIRGNTWLMIILATIIGLIPESGPHMIFVTMFASGVLPFPVLLASSIAQDGHACLPLLAENKRSFAWAKLLKSVIALAVGFLAMLF